MLLLTSECSGHLSSDSVRASDSMFVRWLCARFTNWFYNYDDDYDDDRSLHTGYIVYLQDLFLSSYYASQLNLEHRLFYTAAL